MSSLIPLMSILTYQFLLFLRYNCSNESLYMINNRVFNKLLFSMRLLFLQYKILFISGLILFVICGYSKAKMHIRTSLRRIDVVSEVWCVRATLHSSRIARIQYCVEKSCYLSDDNFHSPASFMEQERRTELLLFVYERNFRDLKNFCGYKKTSNPYMLTPI